MQRGTCLLYTIGYSPGIQPLDGYLGNSADGECLSGYKMAMKVQPLGNQCCSHLSNDGFDSISFSAVMLTNTGPPPDATTNGESDDNKDLNIA